LILPYDYKYKDSIKYIENIFFIKNDNWL
jgi:hypothetical protein